MQNLAFELTSQRQAFKHDVPDFFETLLGGSFRSFVCSLFILGTTELMYPERGDDCGNIPTHEPKSRVRDRDEGYHPAIHGAASLRLVRR